MKTILFHPERDADAIPQAAAILRRGGLLGIPTETVYGLGADALNETAVRHIFEAKGRPQDNPLIIHVPDASWLERYCREVPETAYRLAERFWPGPLTMILPRREIVPLQTTGGLETVGVRCPDHPVTRAIIEAAGVPVAAPSGNTSGRPSPTTAGHMAEDMDGKIDGIVDGGPCAVGVESTIIDLTMTPPRLLRPGGLPLEALEEVLGTVAVDKAVTGLLKDGEKPRAPGMTFKTVVAAAALETGEYQTDTEIPAGSSYTLPGTVTQLTNAVSQADGSDGKITLEDAMAYSSNTAFAQLGVALGDDKVSSMAKKLGFDSPITVDGSDSTGTPWMSVASKFPTDTTDDKLALASIGQGDTVVTPLQNALVAAAVANGGKVMQPTLVDRVRSSDLSVISQTKPQVMSRAFSSGTANKLTQMMEAVVTKENPNLAIDGMQVTAKTGTAQIGDGNTSIDGWVVGFAPADDPKIAVAVVVHNVDLYGSFAAGPIMKAMMQEALAE